jgi:hypothetical protein
MLAVKSKNFCVLPIVNVCIYTYYTFFILRENFGSFEKARTYRLSNRLSRVLEKVEKRGLLHNKTRFTAHSPIFKGEVYCTIYFYGE